MWKTRYFWWLYIKTRLIVSVFYIMVGMIFYIRCLLIFIVTWNHFVFTSFTFTFHYNANVMQICVFPSSSHKSNLLAANIVLRMSTTEETMMHKRFPVGINVWGDSQANVLSIKSTKLVLISVCKISLSLEQICLC